MQSRAIGACIGRGDPKRGLDHPWADCVDADAETRGVKRRDPRPKPTARTEAPSASMASSADKATLPSFAVSYWSVSRRWLRSCCHPSETPTKPTDLARNCGFASIARCVPPPTAQRISCPLSSPRRPLCVANRVPKAYRIDRVDAQSLDYTRIATRDGVGADQGFKGHIELIKVFDETHLDAFRFSSVGSPRRGDYVIKVNSWELRSTTMFGEEFDRLPVDDGDIRWDE
jgi:hypothetical protein